MAKLVKLPKGKEFQFRASKSGGASHYNWDQWFDGQTWLLEQSQGEKNNLGTVVKVTEKRDFEGPIAWMPSKVKIAGRKRYKVVQVSRVDAEGEKITDGVIIKARDMTPDERVAEDALRAHERATWGSKKKAPVAVANGQIVASDDEEDEEDSEESE